MQHLLVIVLGLLSLALSYQKGHEKVIENPTRPMKKE
jgi:hypothetical protein